MRTSKTLLLTVIVVGCYDICPGDPRIDRWLTCEECIDGERAAVAAMGKDAMPRLKQALIGPSAKRSELMKAKFADTYSSTPIPGLTQQEYVQSLYENYVATYQKRAATSMADIGGSDAIQAITDAIQDSATRHYRADVMEVIALVDAALRYPRFGGVVKPARVSFGQLVNVIAAPNHPFSSPTRAFVVDAPFSPAEVPVTLLPDTLRFPALGDLGTHVVAIDHGGAANREVAVVSISSLVDSNDSATIECAGADTACMVSHAPLIQHTFPFSTFVALWAVPPKPDQIDFFRIAAGPASLPVTARLSWNNAQADLDLLWKRCSPFTTVGNALGATSSHPEQTSDTIPAGQCWVLLVVMRPGPTQPVFAHLTLTSP